MKRKIASGLMLTLLLIGMLTVAFNIQQVKASGTIYIRADGSIDPPTANITSVDNVTYTFTGLVNDSIIVERDNIVVDGASHTLQATGYMGRGLDLSGRSNVTIKNMEIREFDQGVYLFGSSSNNTVVGNNITNNEYGIVVEGSLNNSISGNNIINNNEGIALWSSLNNSIVGNKITNYGTGIQLSGYFDSIVGNKITNNWYGILAAGQGNYIYHNYFVDNTEQVVGSGLNNEWDDGYPSGGNYWSDYAGADIKNGPNQDQPGGDGMGDTPYVIDAETQDNYPFMGPLTFNIAVTNVTPYKTVVGQGYNLSINVTVMNEGDFTETFNVTAYYGNATITPEQWGIFWSMGDMNRDGYIDLADYDIWVANWGWIGPPGGNPADINIDGIVDLDDYLIWAGNQGLDIWTYFISGALIETQTVNNLSPGTSTTLVFTWNTTGVSYGNYTLSAYAPPLSGENFITNNNYGDGIVMVTIPGDVNGDRTVNIFDIGYISAHWYPGPPIGPLGYHPNADINNDGAVNIFDIGITSAHWGQSW